MTRVPHHALDSTSRWWRCLCSYRPGRRAARGVRRTVGVLGQLEPPPIQPLHSERSNREKHRELLRHPQFHQERRSRHRSFLGLLVRVRMAWGVATTDRLEKIDDCFSSTLAASSLAHRGRVVRSLVRASLLWDLL